jgi:hypothetical protein
MKKLFFLFAFLGIAVVVFHSCKKDKVQSPENDGQEISYTAEELSIWRNLSDFNSKIKSGLKSEEFISPDSAMWFLETLFNVQQATDTTFNEYKTYKKTYSLNVNGNGSVNMSDVTSVYNQMVNDLNDELGNIDADYKYFIIGDLIYTPTRDGNYTMSLISGFGINPLAFYRAFNSDDDWRYGNKKGKCVNPAWDSDGGMELARRFNHPGVTTSGNSWINPETTDILSHENYPGRIYYEKGPATPPCMEYTELQGYLVDGYYIIYNTSNETPKGEQMPDLTFKVMELWTNTDEEALTDSTYWHKYQITYAEHVTLPPIED